MSDSERSGRLTRAQRLHFDIYGYVLLRGALAPDEVAAMRAALYRLRAEPDRASLRVYTSSENPYHLHLGHLIEYDPALLAYAVHPQLIPAVEEVVGGAVRLEETEAVLNRRDPARILPADRRIVPLGFHTGTRHGWGTFEEGARFHCLFVKTLAFLTDVGPDDGGTAVIPGSHRLSWPQEEIIAAANEDESLAVQVEAKAGDVLLFPESLVHSTTAVRSERERVILISGYTATFMREWPGNIASSAFVAAQPERVRQILTGGGGWPWPRG